MPPAFVDSAYDIAILLKTDDLHERALQLSSMTDEPTVTTDGVCVEVLAHVCDRGSHLRALGLQLFDGLRTDPNVTIVRQTPELFDAGIELYRQRPDKGCSLTDCMSMLVCRQLGIVDVLTHDRHFEQEGFSIFLL